MAQFRPRAIRRFPHSPPRVGKNRDETWGMNKEPKGPVRALPLTYVALFQIWNRRKEIHMKYLFAWALGVPGVLVIAWFLFSHH